MYVVGAIIYLIKYILNVFHLNNLVLGKAFLRGLIKNTSLKNNMMPLNRATRVLNLM
jgi:hypothetical protein